jgi:hypothetical protein
MTGLLYRSSTPDAIARPRPRPPTLPHPPTAATVARSALLVVRTSSGAGFGEGACPASRATASCACKSSRIGPPASTSATIATAAKRSPAGVDARHPFAANATVGSAADDHGGGRTAGRRSAETSELLLGTCAVRPDSVLRVDTLIVAAPQARSYGRPPSKRYDYLSRPPRRWLRADGRMDDRTWGDFPTASGWARSWSG